MSTKRYKPEQIGNLLRPIDVEVANGRPTPPACRFVVTVKDTTICSGSEADEALLTQAINTLASSYGRHGYRRIPVLLREAGWRVGKDRGERIFQWERLRMPQKRKHSLPLYAVRDNPRACGSLTRLSPRNVRTRGLRSPGGCGRITPYKRPSVCQSLKAISGPFDEPISKH